MTCSTSTTLLTFLCVSVCTVLTPDQEHILHAPLGQHREEQAEEHHRPLSAAQTPQQEPIWGLMPQSVCVTTKHCMEMPFHGVGKALPIHTGTNCSPGVVKPKEGYKGSWKRQIVLSKEVTHEEVSKRVSYSMNSAWPFKKETWPCWLG